MHKLILIGLTVALAGCGGGEPAAQNASSNEAIDRAAAVSSDGIDMNAGPALVQPSSNSSAQTEDGAIPVAFHGRWGMVPGDCTSTRGDAKGLLVIDDDMLRFYESRAIPRNLQMTGPNEWRAELDYSGEGQTWSEMTTLTLLDGGRTLRRMGDGPWTYRRCEVQ